MYTISNSLFNDYFLYLMGGIIGILLYLFGIKYYFLWVGLIILFIFSLIFIKTKNKSVMVLSLILIWFFFFMVDVISYKVMKNFTSTINHNMYKIIVIMLKSILISFLIWIKLELKSNNDFDSTLKSASLKK